MVDLMDLTSAAKRLYRRMLQRPEDSASAGGRDGLPRTAGVCLSEASSRRPPAGSPSRPPADTDTDANALHSDAAIGPPRPSIAAEADGASAVGALEAWLAEAGCMGGALPASVAGARFADEAERHPTNLFRRPTDVLDGVGGRRQLAAALGLASAGVRASAFLSGPDLAASLDLLADAARRRLPLVVHLAARAGGRNVLGSGHEAFHAAASTGAVLLHAANVQEAVDLTLLARRLAEDALTPVVVAMDGAETALAPQDFELPPTSAMRRLVGRPEEIIHPPTPSQEVLFGKHRRRLPRRHDADRPLLTGAAEGPDVHALAAAARDVFFDVHLPGLWDQAVREWEILSGRRVDALRLHCVKGAELLLVAQGSAVETAEAVAEFLRTHEKLKVGVVGLRCLRPLPSAELLELLRGCRAVAVLERTTTPALAEPPLTTELRALLLAKDRPTLVPVLYGLGGHALAAADLAALARRLLRTDVDLPERLYLGFDLALPPGGDPRRQALRDTLTRHYFGAAHLGIHSSRIHEQSSHFDPRPEGSLTVSIHRLEGAGRPAAARRPGAERLLAAPHGSEFFVGEAALFLRRLLGGHLRSRRGLAWELWGGERVDLLTHAPADALLRDPGDDVASDVAVWLPPTALVHGHGALSADTARTVLRRLRPGGALLVVADGVASGTGQVSGDALAPLLPEVLRRALGEDGIELHAVDGGAQDGGAQDGGAQDGGAQDGDRLSAGEQTARREERLLGALLAVLTRTGKVETTLRALLKVRRAMLDEAAEENLDARLDALEAGFEGVVRLGLEALPPSRREFDDDSEPSAAVRRLGRADQPLGDVAEAWARNQGLEQGELLPDPFLAVGSMAPLTGALRSTATLRDLLPAFDPALCVGCGGCWSVCPDGAVRPAVVRVEDVLELGLRRAREGGAEVDALRMTTSKLAARLRRELAGRSEGARGGRAGELLDLVFPPLLDGLKLPDARKDAIRDAFVAVRNAVADLPLVRTASFFDAAKAEREGDGELLALAIDPDACKGCALCVAACAAACGATSGASTDDSAALRCESADPQRDVAARRVLRLAESLPEPTPAALERAAHAAELVPLAAALLPRAARDVLAGVDGAEAGSGETLAVRRVLGAAAARRRPVIDALRAEVADLRERLAAALHDELARALPDRDLDALARGLEGFHQPDTDLASLTTRIETAFETDRVDVSRTRRLVEAARAVADLEGRLGEPGGLLPAPLGVVLGPGGPTAWGAALPHNPFAVPVTVDAVGELGDIARGLALGARRDALDTARVLRRARLELERPREAARADFNALAWSELNADERRRALPVFAVASASTLRGSGLAGVLEALGGDLAIRVLVLSDPPLEGELGEAAALDITAFDIAALAKAAGGWAARTSIAAPEHLAALLDITLDAERPMLLDIHAPSPARHGLAADAAVDTARRALESGRWTLWRGDAVERPEPPAAKIAEVAPQAAPPADKTAEIVAALRAQHTAEVAALRAQHLAELGALRGRVQSELAGRIRGKLLQVALAESSSRGEGETPS